MYFESIRSELLMGFASFTASIGSLASIYSMHFLNYGSDIIFLNPTTFIVTSSKLSFVCIIVSSDYATLNIENSYILSMLVILKQCLGTVTNPYPKNMMIRKRPQALERAIRNPLKLRLYMRLFILMMAILCKCILSP